jgi:hypothetical protein
MYSANSLEAGDPYSKAPDVITIGILNNSFFKFKGFFVKEVSPLFYKDERFFGSAHHYYFQLPKFRLNKKHISQLALILTLFKAISCERLEEIRNIWNKSYGHRPGGDLMDKIVDTMLQLNKEPGVLNKIYDEFHARNELKFIAIKEEAAKYKKMYEELVASKGRFPEDVDKKLDAKLKPLKEGQAKLDADLKPLKEGMARIIQLLEKAQLKS